MAVCSPALYFAHLQLGLLVCEKLVSDQFCQTKCKPITEEKRSSRKALLGSTRMVTAELSTGSLLTFPFVGQV